MRTGGQRAGHLQQLWGWTAHSALVHLQSHPWGQPRFVKEAEGASLYTDPVPGGPAPHKAALLPAAFLLKRDP